MQLVNLSVSITARVCVDRMCPVPLLAQLMTMLAPPSRGLTAVNLDVLSSVAVSDEVVVLPIGVRNGLTGAVPLESVMFGVANAGEATTATAETKTSATSKPLLRLLNISKNNLSPEAMQAVWIVSIGEFLSSPARSGRATQRYFCAKDPPFCDAKSRQSHGLDRDRWNANASQTRLVLVPAGGSDIPSICGARYYNAMMASTRLILLVLIRLS